MNKQKFNSYLKNPQKLSREELDTLDDLANSFPYSQVVQSLTAKAHHLSNSKETNQKITQAAIRATNRGVLKSFIQEGKNSVSKKPRVKPKKAKLNPNQKKTEKAKRIAPKRTGKVATIEENTIDQHNREMEELRSEVLDNLSRVIKIKEEISQKEGWSDLEDWENNDQIPTSEESITDTESKIIEPTETSITEASENVDKESIDEKETTEQESGKSDHEIIDSFINKGSKISPRENKEAGEIEDLSDKNSDFTEDLISENLALILLDQGKKKRAIDIYKKLIWKYPQKKAYFAAKLEDLEK